MNASANHYDLVVIGTGTAAGAAAVRCRSAGWRVAMIDSRPFGGTCALRGCDPKKVLLAAAEAVDAAARLAAKGVVRAPPQIDWPALMRFKRSFTDPVPESRRRKYAELGIDAREGRARLAGRAAVTVNGATLHTRHILIASGAEPVPLPIEGAELLATSDDFLSLERLPRRIGLVGGGYIAFEFAHIAARAGAQVTMFQRGEQALPQFDPALVDALIMHSRRLGIDVRLGCEVGALRKGRDGVVMQVRHGDEALEATVDLAVHAAGRRPAVEALDLEAGGVAHHGAALRLNEFLQSESNPAVYAAGDAAATRLPLTPVASLEGETVAANLLEGNRHRVDYRGIPSVVFTLPPLARVGLSAAEAAAAGLDVETRHALVPDWYTARRVNEPCYGYRTLVERGSGRLLGAHLVGPDAAETINLFALAIRHGLTAGDLKSSLTSYPTAASDIGAMLP